MEEALVVLTTVGENFDAVGLSRALVDARLAACVNILGHMQSVYRWEGTIHQEHEQLLVIKTTSTRLAELRETLLARHPYDVPELIVLTPREMSEKYLAWLVESTT
jgi:periplasmic divalent cation tolerance protein